ncbi:MAG: DUF3365 domain-containing protein [Acidobacteria bacterium]|nr:DUF3365 domain-containing protein [Acidobacteriota bacterium]
MRTAILAGAGLLTALVALAVAVPSADVPPVVSAEWLGGRLAGPGLIVVDARPTRDYLAGHLPGAQSLQVDNLRSMSRGVPGELFPADLLAVVFGRLGIRPDSTVVAYGAGGDYDATYLAMVLRAAGVPGAAVLDGGLARWRQQERPTTVERPRPEATSPQLDLEPGFLANLEDVRRAVASGEAVLLDSRPKEQYEKGHIPGAVSRPYSEDFVPPDQPNAGSFRPADQLRAEYRTLGVRAGRPAIVYCNSGHMASSVYYVLRHVLGHAETRLFDGSWLEWTAHPDAPVATGSDDPLLRARRAADALGGELMARLLDELQDGGPAHAIGVCAEIAPRIARQHSRDGLVIRRTTLRARNPANAPDEWENAQLAAFKARHESGEKPGEIVERTGGKLRLLRPIFAGALCLECHGDPARIDPEVRQTLARRYPADQATGYAEGDFRGAISVSVDTGVRTLTALAARRPPRSRSWISQRAPWNRSLIVSQQTTFHHALRYSPRRFWYFR